MNNPKSVRALALSVLNKKRDSAWDNGGTVAQKPSQASNPGGTAKIESIQSDNPTVPLSHTLGTGTVGQWRKSGTALGTTAGQSADFPYADALDQLESRCPEYIDPERWQQCIRDAERFLAAWGDKAFALGWSADDLFGLHSPPAKPRPVYSRLTRYDATGLCWLLEGRRVIALSADTAAIECGNGNVVTYRKYRKPALGPLGDSLDDFTG
jgi:hypothetical protein